MTLTLLLELTNIVQYMVFVHQHKDVYPDDREPYGLYKIVVPRHEYAGHQIIETYGIKDNWMKRLPRKEVPCQQSQNDQEITGYTGGIGDCIEGENEVTPYLNSLADIFEAEQILLRM